MNTRSSILHDYPNAAFITICAISSFFALRPSPSALPIIVTLSALLLYSHVLFPAPRALRHVVLLCIAIALGGSLSRLTAFLHALSTPGISLLMLFSLSLITSVLTMSAIYMDKRLCMRLPSRWSQLTLFPTLWATLWFAVSYVSPVGRLSAWSPMQGAGPYEWMVPIVGPAGNDWVVAAWAVVCSHAIGAWFMGSQDMEYDDDEPLLIHHDHVPEQPRPMSHASSTLLLAALLVTLALPSFLLNDFPSPILSTDSTTSLSVGCVLPSSRRHEHSLTLDDYVKESQKLTSSAKILLWPEGAVSFDTEAEKNEAFSKVRELVTGSYVGVSFEETFSDSSNDNGRSSSKRTGLAIISKASSSPHLVYYKRHLVPVAESFSLSHSMIPPGIFTLDLPHPNGIKGVDWAPGPNHTRPIHITSSICLDFADPLPFAELNSRPALILAPARTWDLSVGYVMWQQAKQRAVETGSMVLWCDGGDGGVSGIAGHGYHDFTQVGSGSWVKTIGFHYPFNERRTVYAYFGDFSILLFWALTIGNSFVVNFIHGFPAGRMNVESMKQGLQRIRNTFRGRVEERRDLLD